MQAKDLEQGLYQMPGTSGEVPAIFMSAEDAAMDNEVTAAESTEQALLYDGDAIVLD